MTDNKPENAEQRDKKKPLGLKRPGRLELKKTVESGHVRQSFSHGRTKTVQVEKKKKRTFQRSQTGNMTEVQPAIESFAPPSSELISASTPEEETAIRQLTIEEKAARARAVEGALKAEHEVKEGAIQDSSQDEAAIASTADESRGEAPVAEPSMSIDEGLGADQTEQLVEDEQDSKTSGASLEAAEGPPSAPSSPSEKSKGAGANGAAGEVRPAGRDKEGDSDTEDGGRGGKGKRKGDGRRLSIGRQGVRGNRRARKMTVSQALNEEERQRSLASVRRAREREKRSAEEPAALKKIVREVTIPEVITVQELANRMAVRGAEVVKVLMKMGLMATINEVLEGDTAELVVDELGHKVKRVSEADVEVGLKGDADESAEMMPRPPIVTIMGHVDHGKTSLLDVLRNSDVVAGEAGGITQHIGAYQIVNEDGRKITLIDTPGHAAFSQMRARGANTTDIVVLVVAADDGVMPQTIEAIQHAQAAQVPIIVAINKIDLPDSNPDKVRNELLQHNVILEHVGGDVLSIEISAKNGLNLDKLIESIHLQAELMELKANPSRSGEGVAIEARLERGKGVVTTVLVQRGTIRQGDILVVGDSWGRVRALSDDRGSSVDSAGPSQPAEVLGLNSIPSAGDEVVVVSDEARAREVTEYRGKLTRDQRALAARRGTVDQMFSDIDAGEAKQVPLVVKTDTHGSLEAIQSSIANLETEEVSAHILLSGVGGITESDVSLASASGAIAIGFNVRADSPARNLARRDGVEIRYYSIIYELLEEVGQLMSGFLAPKVVENTLGYARVKEVFAVSKVGKVAGCEITEGLARKGAHLRLVRDSVVIHEGKMSTLKRHKDDVREVKEGLECGIGIDRYQDIKEGDVIELFEAQEVARSITDA
tara:strand:- start:5242 stop:7893 length:2652 start_codon:yes stop_codon:yes gene_type:complete